MKLTIGEAAKLLGYNSSYFSNRRKQFDDFGPPSLQIGGKTKFDHNDVLNWARENSRKINPGALEKLLIAYGELTPNEQQKGFETLEGEFSKSEISNDRIARLLHLLDEERHKFNRLFDHIQIELAKLDAE